jgi:putative acetyltransferase
MHIRSERATDIPAIRALNHTAFQSDTEANLIDALRVQAPEAISLVALEDDHVAGHIMFSSLRLTGAPDLRAMALAPMAVTPERQRAGIGSALVRHGLEECRRRGVDVVFVVGHPAYYPRFGFSLASGFGVTCEFDVPDEAFMALELVSGALRGRAGTVLFHEAFRAS